MSTRANIIFRDGKEKLYFYRHSDGYPECTLKDLKTFVNRYSTGQYRANISQSAGHLILQGHKEYSREGLLTGKYGYTWKVGAYEPAISLHCDVEYVYVIDLVKGRLEARECKEGFWSKPILRNTKLIQVVEFDIKER
jgi:hypothetical protein